MDASTLLTESNIAIPFIEKLFEKTTSGFFAKNTKGEIISINNFMLSIYGVATKQEVLGKFDYDFFPEHIAKAITLDDKTVLREGKTITDKIEMVPFVDYKTHWLKTSKYPLKDSNNTIIGMIGVTSKLKESTEYSFKNEKLIKVLNHMESHLDKKISLDELCAIACMSKTSLLRHFNETFQISPLAYLKKVRLHLACKMLRNTDKSLASISQSCGYYDQSHFNKDFKSLLNTTPRKYKLQFGIIQ